MQETPPSKDCTPAADVVATGRRARRATRVGAAETPPSSGSQDLEIDDIMAMMLATPPKALSAPSTTPEKVKEKTEAKNAVETKADTENEKAKDKKSDLP
eukprot:6457083-Lingulodinium_polyedra.AAC.1